jgi:hypothetical protein
MLDQAQGNSPDIVIMDGSQASSFLRDTLTIGGTAILRGETADDPGYGFADSVASGLSMCPRRLEPVINFVPLESRKYPNVSLSLTMEAWGTRGKSAIQAM